jgi:DNA-binding response OmpR family regulator
MKKKILLIDDSKPMLALLTGVFRGSFEVISKGNAMDALESLQEGLVPDLIITDLNMPVMDGTEFIKILKNDSFYDRMPIMVLSGNQSSTDRLSLYKLGIDEYLTKPFNPEELFIRAEKLIQRVKKYEMAFHE